MESCKTILSIFELCTKLIFIIRVRMLYDVHGLKTKNYNGYFNYLIQFKISKMATTSCYNSCSVTSVY